MPELSTRKTHLRSALRRRRRALPSEQQLIAATSLLDSVTELPLWASATRIAVYLPADGEIDTSPLEDQARTEGKIIFLPVITAQKHLHFREWNKRETLISNRYGIAEPSAQANKCASTELDIIFLPLIGWDVSGGRLGMGGGYYDRTLADSNGPLLVGLAHTCQQVTKVPREAWDVGLHYVATDTALHQCASDANSQ